MVVYLMNILVQERTIATHILKLLCDQLSLQLQYRLENQHIPAVLVIKETLLKTVSGDDCQGEIATLETSCFKNDIDWSDMYV